MNFLLTLKDIYVKWCIRFSYFAFKVISDFNKGTRKKIIKAFLFLNTFAEKLNAI